MPSEFRVFYFLTSCVCVFSVAYVYHLTLKNNASFAKENFQYWETPVEPTDMFFHLLFLVEHVTLFKTSHPRIKINNKTERVVHHRGWEGVGWLTIDNTGVIIIKHHISTNHRSYVYR